MTTLNDFLKIVDIDTVLFNKADDKITFVITELLKKFQSVIKNSVFKSELNLIITTVIIALILFVLDPLGKKEKQTENVKVESAKLISKPEPTSEKKIVASTKEELAVDGINNSPSKKVIVYDPLDNKELDAFIAELRNPGFEVTRVKKDKSYKKILRLNSDGMLYWSKENKLFGKHVPWKPESFSGTEQNKSARTYTLKFKSTNSEVIDYVLKFDHPLSEKIIKGLTDLATKKKSDKAFATKVPPTPSRGVFSNLEAANIAKPVAKPVQEENVVDGTPAK
jgi:hypothetical protein